MEKKTEHEMDTWIVSGFALDESCTTLSTPNLGDSGFKVNRVHAGFLISTSKYGAISTTSGSL